MSYEEEYTNLKRLFESKHMDNMKVLRALFSPEDRVLVIGNEKEKVICY